MFGALAMMRNAAAATFSSAAFLGLGFAGLRTENCESICAERIKKELETERMGVCIDNCFRDVVENQPDSLRLYCRALIGFVAPFCELMLVLHAYLYPIKGVRLRRLYNNITMERIARGEESPVEEKSDEVQSHHGSSRINLFSSRSRKKLANRLVDTVAMVDSWPGSKSITVVFDIQKNETLARNQSSTSLDSSISNASKLRSGSGTSDSLDGKSKLRSGSGASSSLDDTNSFTSKPRAASDQSAELILGGPAIVTAPPKADQCFSLKAIPEWQGPDENGIIYF